MNSLKKLLITDDDPLVVNIYKNKFEAEGFDVAVAADGQAALLQIQRQRPDVVLMDLMLPGIDGVKVLQAIRSDPALRDLPVIVLSNAYASSLITAAWKAGATKCFTKSGCTPNHLAAEVRALLSTRATDATTPGETVTGTPVPMDSGGQQGARAETLGVSAQDGLRQQIPQTLARVASLFQRVAEAGESGRAACLSDLLRSMHALAGAAALGGLPQMAQMGSAVEALLTELQDKPKWINPSSLRTVAQAVDFLKLLLQHEKTGASPNRSPLILVVDDEMISRETVCSALEKAGLRAVSVDDPLLALKLLEGNQFDLIFMDVEMPELSGFELCKKLRALPLNHLTPVVFVTALTNFGARAQSALSGGTDLIAKPFLLIELAVKALTCVLRAQFSDRSDQRAVANEPKPVLV